MSNDFEDWWEYNKLEPSLWVASNKPLWSENSKCGARTAWEFQQKKIDELSSEINRIEACPLPDCNGVLKFRDNGSDRKCNKCGWVFE